MVVGVAVADEANVACFAFDVQLFFFTMQELGLEMDLIELTCLKVNSFHPPSCVYDFRWARILLNSPPAPPLTSNTQNQSSSHQIPNTHFQNQ